ncbi:MAG: cell division protein SepF [Erysipelotrichia bacterium]|nr:cell division protein SepF [Erysipelotrichia bacterium]
MGEKLKNFFSNAFCEEDEDDEEESYSEENTSAYEEPRNQQVKAVSNAKMIVKEPRSYDDAKEVAEYLLKGKAVIVNIHKLNESSGTRLLDYLTGVTFAIRGSYQKVDNNVFLFAPNDMPVDGKVEVSE